MSRRRATKPRREARERRESRARSPRRREARVRRRSDATGAVVGTTDVPRAGRSRTWRVALWLLVVATVAILLISGGEWFVRSAWFRVRQVEVIGAHHESTRAVLAATGLAKDPPLIDVTTSAIERDLARFVWIKSVTITKHWPDRVVVTVTERTPVAVAFAPGHRLVYVDATGRDLGAAPLHANLPTLQFTATRSAGWPFLTQGQPAAYVASQLPRAFSTQVSRVEVNAHGDVTLAMTTPVSFYLGPATNLHAKFVSVASVIAHATLSPGDVVDVTVPGSLAVTGGAPS